MGSTKQDNNSQKLDLAPDFTSSSLRDPEARFRYLSEATFEGIILHDKDGIILDGNLSLTKLTGYEVTELIGKNSLTLVSPKSQELMRKNTLCGYEKPYEGVGVRKDGSTFPVELQGKVILREQPVQVLAIRDITERKQTELKLRASQQAAEAGSRAKSEFLATMSHELRTPLNAIMGLSQLLQQEMVGILNDKQREYISCIYSSGEHLLELINDILDLSKVEAGKEELFLSALSVQQLCSYVISTVRDRATTKGLELTTKIDEQVDTCIADERRVKQMLLNLLTNAIKFTVVGQVLLEVKKIPYGTTFIITDTGIGIDPSQFHLLFEPFKQLDSRLTRQYEGTGLGLALTRKLARLHGGDVTVESALGQGCRFTLFLPDQPQTQARENDSSFSYIPAPVHPKTKRILLAQHQEHSAVLLQNYLQTIGYQVERLDNGNDIWEKIQDQQPDLIFLDVKLLKDISEWNLLHRVRQHPDIQVPIVIMMPKTMASECERFKQAGANECLSQPIGIFQIESILMRYLK
jgi:PAS domain S-box-containing protein